METAQLVKVNRCIFNKNEEVIKFIDKYPMFTRKHLDYLA
jgi:hypothetical protein